MLTFRDISITKKQIKSGINILWNIHKKTFCRKWKSTVSENHCIYYDIQRTNLPDIIPGNMILGKTLLGLLGKVNKLF